MKIFLDKFSLFSILGSCFRDNREKILIDGDRFARRFSFMRATIAQKVERLTCNEEVAGSIPAGGSSY